MIQYERGKLNNLLKHGKTKPLQSTVFAIKLHYIIIVIWEKMVFTLFEHFNGIKGSHQYYSLSYGTTICFTLSSGTLLVKAHRDKNLRTYAYTSQLDYFYRSW